MSSKNRGTIHALTQACAGSALSLPFPSPFAAVSDLGKCFSSNSGFRLESRYQNDFYGPQNLKLKIGRFAFLRPPLGDLGATYDDHLRLIGKRVVDFLLALIELFSLGVTAEELRAIIG